MLPGIPQQHVGKHRNEVVFEESGPYFTNTSHIDLVHFAKGHGGSRLGAPRFLQRALNSVFTLRRVVRTDARAGDQSKQQAREVLAAHAAICGARFRFPSRLNEWLWLIKVSVSATWTAGRAISKRLHPLLYMYTLVAVLVHAVIPVGVAERTCVTVCVPGTVKGL